MYFVQADMIFMQKHGDGLGCDAQQLILTFLASVHEGGKFSFERREQDTL